MKCFTQSLTVMGHVVDVHPADLRFTLRCRNGDTLEVHVGPNTEFRVLRNIDNLNRDRNAKKRLDDSTPNDRVEWYVHSGRLITVHGVQIRSAGRERFEAVVVHLLHSDDENAYLFEDTHWWLSQIARMADEWLEDLFDSRRSYRLDDFAELYRTTLNIYGQPTDDNTQECAMLSRLIYGLSSAYLLTGSERFYLAAKAGSDYQRQTFRSLSHDGKYCFWAFGRRKLKDGSMFIEPSQNGDDLDSIPLYEQIYALAGMTQFYRISLDYEILEDLRRTVNAFNDFYLDEKREGDAAFLGHRGYFSHLDYATMRPDTEHLGQNRLRKNWNSIGDHIPAYLVNLLAALDPLPEGRNLDGVRQLRDRCLWMIKECSELIVTHFPDPDPNVPFVNERFYADWSVDHEWGWQRNQAICGHNMKIAWNLTRWPANFFLCQKQRCDKENDRDGSADYERRGAQCLDMAYRLADRMAELGVDQVRSGVFDAVERNPANDMPLQFSWSNTKDFWQQEQGILAYLILYGHTGKQEYLDMARELEAFWNLFFLDRDRRGVYFRVNADGTPVIDGNYANKAGHAVAGYHSFELNYLAHLYTRAYVSGPSQTDDRFCLYFKPSADCGQRSINVLPDFFPPESVRISGISVNSVQRPNFDPDNFRIPLGEEELGGNLVVEFCTCKGKAASERLQRNPWKSRTNAKPDQQSPVADGPRQMKASPITQNTRSTSMANQPLSGKKVAVLLESQYIPEELQVYQKKFKQLGATVHLVSRMWNGHTSQECVSELELDDAKKLKAGTLSLDELPQFLTADVDVEKVKPEDYDAVIMAANYTSVRLRYYTASETPRSTPAVRFFARAMRNRKIIKGALCHGLWILTPYPELLAGREVICHEVIRADIENAGAIVRFPGKPKKPEGIEWVSVDDDLVTGHSFHEADAFVDAIKDQILLVCSGDGPPWVKSDCLLARSDTPFCLDKVKRSRRQILVLVSEWGYWGEELVGPVEVFDAAGYDVQFVTPTGKRPNAITVSMDPEYVDPPLGRPVTSQEMAEKVKRWDNPETPEGKRLEKENLRNLADWFPERPYFSSPATVRMLERYYRDLAQAETDLEAFDALLIVGGSGPLIDLANNQRVHDLILGFYRAGKPIAAECYGITCLAFARNWEDRSSILRGKHVTGHCKEYDYKDGTGFMKSRGQFLDFNMGPPPYPLEYILRDATEPDGQYHGNVGHETSVIVDYPFITGRSTPDSYLTGQKLVEVLDSDPPLRRWGW